jgi:hypothetical protein
MQETSGAQAERVTQNGKKKATKELFFASCGAAGRTGSRSSFFGVWLVVRSTFRGCAWGRYSLSLPGRVVSYPSAVKLAV